MSSENNNKQLATNIKYGLQSKLVVSMKELFLKSKWHELKQCLKLLNPHLTRHYIGVYWKLLLQIISLNLSKSIEYVPQFLDCIQGIHVKSHNEVIYSFIYVLLSQNRYEDGSKLLLMYHLGASYSKSVVENEINVLINSLNANIHFIKWKQASSISFVSSSVSDDKMSAGDSESLYVKQMAERCSFQLNNLLSTLDIADMQISKLIQILIYYEKVDDVHELLENYSNQHPDYLNAQKYLLRFEIDYLNQANIHSFEKLVKLCPSDSSILEYVHRFNDCLISIDCLFDMLDYAQWKLSDRCWNALLETLVAGSANCSLRECIRENWTIRKDYWTPYHFNKRYALFHQSCFRSVAMTKFRVACILLGPDDSYVRIYLRKYNNEEIKYKKLKQLFDIHRSIFNVID